MLSLFLSNLSIVWQEWKERRQTERPIASWKRESWSVK